MSIQARRRFGEKGWEAMTEMGREKSGKDALDWIQEVQEPGITFTFLHTYKKTFYT